MYEALIVHLRECAKLDSSNNTYTEAADAIEKLQAAEKKYLANISALETENQHLKREREWIPVTERLPVGGDDSGAVCENVCLMMDDGTVSCGWMNGTTKKVYYLNARDDFIIKAPITRVTHWMPLPEPPKKALLENSRYTWQCAWSQVKLCQWTERIYSTTNLARLYMSRRMGG